MATIYENRTTEFLEALETLVEEVKYQMYVEKVYFDLSDAEIKDRMGELHAIGYSCALASDRLKGEERELFRSLRKTLYESL